MSDLRSRLIRLAHSNPSLRADILPVLKAAAGMPPKFPQFEVRFGKGRGFTMMTDPPGYTRGDAQAVKDRAVEVFEAVVRPVLERAGYVIGPARLNQARPGEITWSVQRNDPSVDEMMREIVSAVNAYP